MWFAAGDRGFPLAERDLRAQIGRVIRVVFFDGACAFCSAWVVRLCRLDRRGVLVFAPLQGRLAVGLGLDGHADPAGGTLVVLREADGRVFIRSEALIEIARALGGPWRLALVARVVPLGLRDRWYGWVARHRRRIPVPAAACDLADPRFRARLRE